jgi:[ribosomal protein S5]-alanine N-acetyltransferase
LRARFAKLESEQSADGQEKWLNWVVRLPSSELIGYVQATVKPDHRANIAYEFSSAYWGRGLTYQSVQAMMAELHDQYGVSILSATLKENNLRSKRLLERLGFKLTQADTSRQLMPGEIFMQRETV